MYRKEITGHRLISCFYFTMIVLAIVDIYFDGLVSTNVITIVGGAFMWFLHARTIAKLKKLAKIEEEGLNI